MSLADHSSGGIPSSLVYYMSVIAKPRKGRLLPETGPKHHKKTEQFSRTSNYLYNLY
jgi:hypothetical protein